MSLIPAFEIGAWNAWVFMAAFIVYIFVMSLIFRNINEKMGHGGEKRKINTTLFPVMVILMIYSIFLPLVRGTAWFYVGSAIFLLGLIILALTVSDADATPDGELFTRGVYRFSRHPLYLSFALAFLGTGIASASWLFLLLTVILIVLTHSVMVLEEQLTLERYGDSYSEYLEKTPRWIGLPRGGQEDEV